MWILGSVIYVGLLIPALLFLCGARELDDRWERSEDPPDGLRTNETPTSA